MSACLNDARIQAVADGEATSAEIDHADGCANCTRRVAEAREASTAFAHGMHSITVPPLLGARVNAAVARSETGRGATTLRPTAAGRPRWLAASVAAAAAVLALVFVLFPSFDSSTRLSAAEILDRSLQSLSVEGTERLRYQLSVQAPSTSIETGTFVIEQLIDHQTGRWRFARFAPDGTLLNGIAENPAAGTRDAVMTLDGQTYRFHFEIAADQTVALWSLQRRYAESMIRLVQASGTHVVTSDLGPDGDRYVVEMPATTPPDGPLPFSLDRARVVVDASDYHVVEFNAAGVLMGERASIGYELIQRDILGGHQPDSEFSFPESAAGAIEFRGQGTNQPPRDFLSLLLRQLTARQR
jgi:hypothetical protein